MKNFVIICFLLINSIANAQIVYVDIPDKNINYTTASDGKVKDSIDINADGIYDIEFVLTKSINYQSNQGGGYSYWLNSAIIGIGKTKIKKIDASNVTMVCAVVLSLNDSVSSEGVWNSSGSIRFSSSSASEYCYLSFSDKFFAIKLDINGNTHFGWIHIDRIDFSGQIVVKGYAYNSIPNESILAGEGADISVFVKKNQEVSLEIQMYPNPVKNWLYFNQYINYNVFDLQGKLILKGQGKSIDVSSLQNNLYLITMTQQNGDTYRRKFLKQ